MAYFHALARVAAACAIAASCAQDSGAQDSGAQSAAPVQLAALLPQDVAPLPPVTPRPPGPFGLGAGENQYSARWRNLQPLLRIEAQMLAMCRSNPEGCPAPAAKFLGIVEAARARDGRARIGEVNRAVNLAIRPVADNLQYGVAEFWASPLTTFSSGAGDCEDYAIAKYVALRESGMAAADLRLVIVRDGNSGEDHAVVAARVDGDWLLLDNRHMGLVKEKDAVAMTAVFALGEPAEAETPATASAPAVIQLGDDFSV